MAARIPELDAELDRGAQAVIDAAGYRDTGEKLINAVSSLFNFVPKFYHSVREWVKVVQDSEKVIYEAVSNMHNKMTSQDGEIDSIKQVLQKGDENVTKSVSGIVHQVGNMRGELQQLAVTVVNLQQELHNIKAGGGIAVAGGGNSRGPRTDNILNNKAVYGLKPFQSDKAGFRTWNDKPINALTPIAPDMRKVMTKS